MYRCEALVEHAFVVEDRATFLFVRPRDRWKVWIGPVSAGEHLVARSHWIKEVNGVSTRQTMPSWPDVDGHAVVGKYVGSASDVIPIVEPERKVVQTAVRTLHEGNVVWLCGPFEERDDLVALTVEQLLGEAEVEDVLEERSHDRDFFRVNQHVVDAGRGDADETLHHRRRVEKRQFAAHLVHVSDEFHLLTRGKLEPNRFSLANFFAVGHPLHRVAGCFDSSLEVIEVIGVLDLECEAIQPDAGVVADGQTMVVAFVPAFEEDAVIGALGDLQAHDLCVIGSGEFEVCHGDVDMAETQDAHALKPMASVTQRGYPSRIAGRKSAKYAASMSKNRLTSVANAARVLKAFSTRHPTWGVADLATHLDISTSTVHRLLSTLADEGVLDQDAENGRYRLGLSVFDMAASMPKHRTLHEAVLVSMTELRSRTGETVQVGVLDGREVVYVERLDSPNTLRVFTEVGRRNSAHRTSTGKLLIAHLTSRQRERLLTGWVLEKRTPHTITDPASLREELTLIRSRGYAENRQESEMGIVSVAAPIRDRGGRVVAALSLAGPTDRMDDNRTTYVEAVMVLARTVSLQMGWTG